MVDGVDFVRRQLGPEGHPGRASCAAPRRGPSWSAVWALVAALGCGGQQPFPGSAGSLDELGGAVLDAFERGDRNALESFRLTETEHNAVVWPELPAAQGPSSFPLDLAWQNIQLRNGRAIPRAANALDSARPLAFESVECVGAVQTFETFSVHTDCHVHFRSNGRRYRLQLFKDMLERNGGYKIFRYYDEDPELVGGAAVPPAARPEVRK